MGLLTSATQESLLAILCYDDTPKGAKFVRTLVPAKQYDAHYRDIAEAAEEYIDKYHKVPGEHTLDIVESLMARREEDAEIYKKIFRSLIETKDQINREYILSNAAQFARRQRLKRGATKLIELLERGDDESLNEAEATITSAVKSSYDLFDPGTFLHETDKALRFLDREGEWWPCGIKEFDALHLGTARKRLDLYVAPSNSGKSWWCVNKGKYGLIHRAKVCHISCEMAEEEVIKRYLMAFFSISSRDVTHVWQKFNSDELGRFVSMEDVVVKGRPFFRDPLIRQKLTEMMEIFKTRTRLVVREFPTGSLTMPDLRLYLDSLEGSQGFIPDILIVDYPDLMALNPRYKQAELTEIYKQLRGLAKERNIGVSTVTQGNRESFTVRTVKAKDVADDINKVFTADDVYAYSQTEDEEDLGLARLATIKVRGEERHTSLVISQAYGIGQYCTDSVKMQSNYWRHIEKADEATAHDKNGNGKVDDKKPAERVRVQT